MRRAFRLALRRGDLTDREIDEELRAHIEHRVDQLMSHGLTRTEAIAEARRRFGCSWDDAVARLHEAGRLREGRLATRERLDAWWHDLRYAVRTLSRQRAFALVVIATFALGIGANATMFGVIDRLLLQPPPGVVDAASVLEVGFQGGNVPKGAFLSNLHYPLSTVLRADTSVFSDVAAATDPSKYPLGRGASAQQISGVLASGTYFTTLRARAAIGRFFGPDDDRDINPGAVVLSYGFWQRQFGGARGAIGQTLQIGPRFFTVVGVAPRGFTGMGPERVDVWIPAAGAEGLRYARGSNWRTDWGSYWIHTLARVRPGVDRELAVAHATAAYDAGRAAWEATRKRPGKIEHPPIGLRSILPSEQLKNNPEAKIAQLLVAVSIVVLLIACANVANLLLARGTERRREIAVRLALGVSRRRLVRLLFAETALLAVLGGVVALLVSMAGARMLRATLLADFEATDSVLDPRVVVMTLVLVVLTSLFAGLAPALSSSRPNVTHALKAGGKEGSRRRSQVATTLIVVQAALSVLLLVGAGLFVDSLRQVAALQLGYAPERVVAATMDLESIGYKDAERNALFQQMRDRLARVPGVASVAAATTHPLHGWASGMWITIPGRDSLPQASNFGPYYNTVSGDYFSTLDLRIVEGRAITDQDVARDARVVVLSEPMARAYWPGAPAVGRCVLLGGDSTCTTVIGVAANARERVTSADERFLSYVPLSPRWEAPASVIIVRSRGDDADRLVTAIRRTMQTTAPDLPFADVQPLNSLLARQIRPWKMGATLFTMFGGLAVIVAALGLYSAISCRVTQRRYEFGVRMALGAHIGDVIRLVMGQGVRAAALGVAAGCVAAILAGRFIADLLFQTSPRNPVVFAIVAAAMLIVAVAATFVPAWRASRVNPATALRAD